ncbi:hypothetical protein DPMN_186535 [Dreissena polymorpha]|uniref:Uncharacterized protein n=1 Tax=Dreissena polymorpha TaxID=45954 RepID=A0A9D4I9F2_DREPO|nr:hypothetical protein DPMN_186535 [Dreissena polymorpha]
MNSNAIVIIIINPLTGLAIEGKRYRKRNDDTEILLQSGLLCAAESNSSIGRDVHSFVLFNQLNF